MPWGSAPVHSKLWAVQHPQLSVVRDRRRPGQHQCHVRGAVRHVREDDRDGVPVEGVLAQIELLVYLMKRWRGRAHTLGRERESEQQDGNKRRAAADLEVLAGAEVDAAVVDER